MAVLIIIVYAAALLLHTVKKAKEKRARGRRLAYQQIVKPIPISLPIPLSREIRKQQPAPDLDLLENCHDFQQCLLALAGKYSLDSFTIATSDGLVFASSGGSTAQEDAANYSRKYNGKELAGIARFSLNHKGSELVCIVRSTDSITGITQKCIESDIKKILNKWI
jgi:hypothetical protein